MVLGFRAGFWGFAKTFEALLSAEIIAVYAQFRQRLKFGGVSTEHVSNKGVFVLIACLRQSLVWGGQGLLLIFVVACDSGEPPAMPTKSFGEESQKEGLEFEQDDDDSDGDDITERSLKSGAYDTGGALIGDPDTQDAVAACHKKGKVYDRFAGDGEGACSALRLAKVDCNEAGIKKLLSKSQAKQFDESLGGSYAGWLIDQCGDCPPDAAEKLCESTSGSVQRGTKVFFVKEDGESMRGKAMVLPVRPQQSSSDDGNNNSDE